MTLYLPKERTMPDTYTPRHAEPDEMAPHNAYDPADSRDRYEHDEVLEALRGLPLDPEKIGDSSVDDWSLSILFLLAGQGDEDSAAYLLPRVQAAALTLLREVGYPGEAFAGEVPDSEKVSLRV